MKTFLLLAAGVLAVACQRAPSSVAPTCTTELEPCAAACDAGSAEACKKAAELTRGTLGALGPDAGAARVSLVDRGCGFRDPKLCLEAARAHLGEGSERVLEPANEACQLDPHVSIPSASGDALSCQDFAAEPVERAHALSSDCDAGRAASCWAFAGVADRYDAARAAQARIVGCERGGLDASDVARCADFQKRIAGAPKCPKPVSPTAFTYLQCPSEAKRAPKQLARVKLEGVRSPDGAEDGVKRALAELGDALTLCHTAGAREEGSKAAKLGLHVVFTRDGIIALVESADASIGAHELDCVLRQAAKLRLAPAPDRAVAAEIRLDLAALAR